jgi:hypothetical protein
MRRVIVWGTCASCQPTDNTSPSMRRLPTMEANWSNWAASVPGSSGWLVPCAPNRPVGTVAPEWLSMMNVTELLGSAFSSSTAALTAPARPDRCARRCARVRAALSPRAHCACVWMKPPLLKMIVWLGMASPDA